MQSITVLLSIASCVAISRTGDIPRWPKTSDLELQLNHMIRSPDGSYIYVSGLNKIYSLNATSLEKISEVTTGPINGIADVTKLLIYYSDDEDFKHIISCGNSRLLCVMRKFDNISVETMNLTSTTHKIKNVAGLTLAYVSEKYFFMACPHTKDVEGHVDEKLCSNPGIFLFKQDGLGFLSLFGNKWKFKSYEDVETVTERYISAFAIGKHRFFLSVQKQKYSGTVQSRIAQVCQGNHVEFSYVDMPLKCGDFTEIVDVDITDLQEDILIAAVFSNRDIEMSAVCTYTFSAAKQK